jgi:hypothetical protein
VLRKFRCKVPRADKGVVYAEEVGVSTAYARASGAGQV